MVLASLNVERTAIPVMYGDTLVCLQVVSEAAAAGEEPDVFKSILLKSNDRRRLKTQLSGVGSISLEMKVRSSYDSSTRKRCEALMERRSQELSSQELATESESSCLYTKAADLHELSVLNERMSKLSNKATTDGVSVSEHDEYAELVQNSNVLQIGLKTGTFTGLDTLDTIEGANNAYETSKNIKRDIKQIREENAKAIDSLRAVSENINAESEQHANYNYVNRLKDAKFRSKITDTIPTSQVAYILSDANIHGPWSGDQIAVTTQTRSCD